LSWGVFWSLGSLVLSTLGTLLVTPVLIRALGTADYGLYLLVLSVSSYGGYFDLGLGWAAGRYFAQDLAAGRRDHLTQRLSSVAAAFLLLGLVATALAVGLGPRLLRAAGGVRQDARLCFFLGSASFLLSMEAGVLAALLRGGQRFGTAGAPAVLASALLFGGSYVVAQGGGVSLLCWNGGSRSTSWRWSSWPVLRHRSSSVESSGGSRAGRGCSRWLASGAG
jgi:O-antigen/teichoic acid export membrane protein